MIPKKIWTFWFNENGEIPDYILRDINSQKIEGYEHNLITLDNCFKDGYVQQCFTSSYQNKKWVKLTDWLRMHYLYNYGGWTLDADVNVIRDFDNLLNNEMVVGDEGVATIPNSRVLGSAVIGAQSKHPMIKKWIEEVRNNFRGDDNLCYESSMHLLNILSFQFSDRMTIVPPDYFYPLSSLTGKMNITENTICVHNLNNSWVEPSASIIIPKLGREEGLRRCLASIEQLNYPKDKIDVHIIEGPETVPVKVEKGVNESKGEYICFLANDTEIEPDALSKAIECSIKNNKGLVAFNTGELLPDGGNGCDHFIIRRDLIEKLEDKKIFSFDFVHTACDNWLMFQAQKLNEYIRCEDAIVHHYHFSKGSPMDSIYEKGWRNVEQDRQVLKNKIQNYGSN